MKQRIVNLLQSPNENLSVTVQGWVKSKRTAKSFAFLVVNDGSCQQDLQCIINEDCQGAPFLESIGTGAAVRVDGILKPSQGKGQNWEVHADRLVVEGLCDQQDYPLQKKGHTMEFLREIGHLRGRTNTLGAVFRVRNTLSQAIHRFFQSRGFVWAHTPIITASDCEGAGELFQVTTSAGKRDSRPEDDFFGRKTFLTVSGQLNGEALALSLGDIYTFGPTFRAENSNTTRHLAEFWMVEPEIAFADLRDVCVLAEAFLREVIGDVLEQNPDELEFLSKYYEDCNVEKLRQVAQTAFTRVSYDDAVKILQDSGRDFTFPVAWGKDLQTEHERFLTEEACKGPVIVMDYPKEIKAFYMRLNGDGKTVAAMDVLVPRIGEIIGGSQREERHDILLSRLRELNIAEDELRWYRDLRRFGCCPHGGFGLGFERLVQYVTGMSNIRDVIPFPRTVGSIRF